MSSLFSQGNELDSIPLNQESQRIVFDSIKPNEKDAYIKDYTNRFNVKLDVNNSIPIFNTPYDDNYVQIEPNLGTKYALVLSYGFLSVRLGIRSKGSDESIENKGEPKTFRLHFKLLFDRWSHQFEYNQIKGFYISESDEPIGQIEFDQYVQFPNLTTKAFNGSTSYKLNDNYSVRATIAQTERQLKSAGSFIPSIEYSIYGIQGTETYLNTDGSLIERESYTETIGLTTIFHLGYHYTIVYKNWYLNASLIPGIGGDFNKITAFTAMEKTKSNYNEFVLSLKGGVGFGYSANNFFLGGFVNRTVRDHKNNVTNTQFKITKDAFSLYLGYRFKAPRQITKPIDQLEEKLPFIDKSN